MDSQIQELRSIVRNSDNIVFFGGAGVSTESGVPDFRSADGLYSQRYPHPPEAMLSHSFFLENTAEFYRFYRDKMVYPDAKPNAAHIKLAELEAEGRLRAVVTQNIDGLHQAAGSRRVLELHGSVHRNFCMDCNAAYPLEHVLGGEGVPRCACGGKVKPDVVLYEEPLDQGVLEEAVRSIREADVMIVGGTSLNVYPAAGLLRHYRGGKLVLINKSELPCERDAALVIRGKIGEVLGQV
ncbi:MAG: NAD-dependent protein deacylase [Methanomassiliicoccaceae archaeon]|nr:NAD-dependent protein deacylase [Methanomassiliicoccaceae archaeon]